MNTSNSAVTATAILGKIASVFGYIGGFLSLFVMIGVLSNVDSLGSALAVIIMLLLFVPCLFAIVTGAQIKNRIRRFKKYVFLISTERITSLESIAERTMRPVDFVRNDLQYMISNKFFTNAVIDTRTNKIVIGGQNSSNSHFGLTPMGNTQEDETVNCPGCGAMNTKQKGISCNCEYCGSLIK